MKTLGVILAGGQGKRMDLKDKGTLQFKGKPLANHVFDRLAPQVDEIIIAGPNDYGLGVPTVTDPISGFQGPLMGIYAALLWNEDQDNPASGLITAPIDCPYTPPDLVKVLLHNQDPLTMRSAYLSDDGQRHPTFALWPRGCLAELKKALIDDDIRAMKLWIDHIGATEITYSGKDPLVNFNRPEDMN